MPSAAEQYLFDHQWGFELSTTDADWGCASCGQTESAYGNFTEYGPNRPGHEKDCELAAILVGAGFKVQWFGRAQGCLTEAQYERAERWKSTLVAGLNKGLVYQIAQVADVPFSVYRTNDVPISEEQP